VLDKLVLFRAGIHKGALGVAAVISLGLLAFYGALPTLNPQTPTQNPIKPS
jgi:hypothetical protein